MTPTTVSVRIQSFLVLLLVLAMAAPGCDRGKIKDPVVPAAAQQALLKHAREVLAAIEASGPEAASKLAAKADPDGVKEFCGRPTYVELYRPARVRRVVVSSSKGCPTESLTTALVEGHQRGMITSAWLGDLEETRIKIDLLGPYQKLPGKEIKKLRRSWFEPGVDGMRMSDGKAEAVSLPSDVLTDDLGQKKNKTVDRIISKLEIGLKIKRDSWTEDSIQLEKFRTVSFVESAPGGTALPLYRGVPANPDPFTPETIEEGLRKWGDWLAAHIDEEGKFLYEYHPVKDRPSPDYNIVRHAGTIYGLLTLYHHNGDKKYLDAGVKALAFVDRHLHRPSEYADLKDHPRLKDQPPMVFYVEDPGLRKWDKANLGSAALALMSYVHLPKELRRPDQQEIVDGLANFMRFMLIRENETDGRFYTTLGQAIAKDIPEKQALYYPGEALLAWMYLYKEDGNPQWLEAAKHVGNYQIEIFEDQFGAIGDALKGKSRAVPDAWVVQALSHLGEVSKDMHYVNACYKMADQVVTTQFTPSNSAFPDYVGGFNNSRPPRSTPAGSRSEGISQAYRLAKLRGDNEKAEEYAVALLRATHFMLHHQYNPANSYYLPNPARAEGGNRGSLIHNEVRIDYNQHCMFAVLEAGDAAKFLMGKGVKLPDLLTGDPKL